MKRYLPLLAALLLSGTTVFAAPEDAGTEAAAAGEQEAGAAQAPEAPEPLASPRTAMFVFLEAMNRIEQAQGGPEAVAAAWEQVERTLADAGLPRPARREAAMTLAAVIDKIGTVEEADLPDRDVVEEAGIGRFVYFPGVDRHREVWKRLEAFDRWPEGRIVLEADDQGQWRFTADTVRTIDRLAGSLEPLAPEHLEAPVTESPQLMGLLGPSFARTPLWGWGALLLAIFLGLAAGKIAQAVLRGVGTRWEEGGREARGRALQDAASPVSLALLTVGIMAGLQVIYIEEAVADFAWRIVAFLYLVAAGWLSYNLVDVIDVALRRLTARTDSKLDDQVVPLIRKTLRIFLVIVFSLVVAQNVFGINITAWLAGLGIAGLAISLAAQDSIKNLFGSITIFFDRPFAVEDYIVFSDYAGVVEEIGFRSTRLRLLSGHLVTVPNMKFMDEATENISARPHIRREMDVTITYDTPPMEIDRAVEILRDILCNHEEVLEQGRFDMEEFAPKVYFNDLNADSLNIKAYYWYQIDGDPDRGWFTFLEHCQIVNRELFRRYGEAGIDFAFPTQTLYIAGDDDRRLTVDVEGTEKT